MKRKEITRSCLGMYEMSPMSEICLFRAGRMHVPKLCNSWRMDLRWRSQAYTDQRGDYGTRK